MRITKEKLVQIIKEELEAVMQEQERQPVRTFYKMGPKALEAAEKMIDVAAELPEDFEFKAAKGDGIDDMHLDVYDPQLDKKILAALGEQLVQEDPDTRFGYFYPGEKAEY